MSQGRPTRPEATPGPPAAEAQHESVLFLLTRLFWVGIGPIFLVLLVIGIFQDDSPWLTATDVAYFVVLVLLPCVRWLELRLGHAKTAEGAPANSKDLWKYTAGTLAIGLAGWIVAKLVGNYLLTV
jgi:hypothetical protein